MVRNPYAFCEGLSRRHSRNSGSYYNIAKFWVMCCRYQIRNIEKLKNSIYFSYEDLTSNPSQVSKKVFDFLPELRGISLEGEFKVFEKSMKISNFNEKQISKLSDGDIYEINWALKEHPDVMSFFHYDYLEPNKKIRFKSLKNISIKIRSMNGRPRAIRWAEI